MRACNLALALVLAAAACTDVRGFEGDWTGARVGDAAVLRVGVAVDATARLRLDRLDRHGAAGVLSVDGLLSDAAFASLEGAEADALAGLTFPGSPVRVYLGFCAPADGGADVLAMLALYDDERVEVRLLRGGPQPVYAVFVLRPA